MYTIDQIIEAIRALPSQQRIRLLQWMNRSAAGEASEQLLAQNGEGQGAAEVDVIPPVTMLRVPPIAPEKGIKKELQWLRDHRDEYANHWVALEEDKLISAGGTAKEVYEAAISAGFPDVLIVLVEPPDALPFAGF